MRTEAFGMFLKLPGARFFRAFCLAFKTVAAIQIQRHSVTGILPLLARCRRLIHASEKKKLAERGGFGSWPIVDSMQVIDSKFRSVPGFRRVRAFTVRLSYVEESR